MTFLHPFDDHAVINGQGTIGLELLEQVQGLEAVVVPIGGGGLISGVACALKESNPAIRVVGVQTERLPSMLRAIENGAPVTLPAEATIADGIAVRRAGDLTLPLVERFVDEIVTVDEEEIANAIMVLLEREKTLAEGAGAVALAALLQKKTSLQGRTNRGPGLRRQYRCKSSGQDHRTRPGQGRPAGSHSRPSCGSAGSPSSPDENPRRPAGKHRRDFAQPCLLWRQFRRYSHRHHARNAGRGAYHRDRQCA